MDSQEALKTLNVKKVWVPILCGLAITGFLFYRSGKISREIVVLLSGPNWSYLCLALLSILLRELGHIYRLRILSNNSLSWRSCSYVALLWEFGTAVTPSVVGGGLVAIFLLSKEGLSMGRSIAYIVVTGIMDNLFFLLACSLGLGGAYEPIFAMAGSLSSSIKGFFFIVYAFFFVYNLVMAIGVFINPNLLKWILIYVTSIGFLKRWRRSAYQLSKDIMITSHEFRGRTLFFWSKIFLCTFLTWMVRYILINCFIAAYCPVSFSEHLAILGKQVVMWALMLIPVSPGGSGIAEFWFQNFFEPMLGDYTLLIALLWRMATFYLYLILGAFLLPKWIQNSFKTKESLSA
ncbi:MULTISPECIES: lysylphosphatidylglycerol synthase transmembrane domain-containing protein [unclassified Candidatus Cardinium]|uniref:lysylphosphatidylglycerol synthase transmembrane domain-containing protein n=1 Tax=unclassified Candidatus Cardinium TaxID=2641185 RepID=UPI001FB36F37|nr:MULTISPECIES: lysylphosphatidylglycerol synthase transmembrane domain-containing protein [unclassified Candidatus Cardinium]